MKKGKMKNNDGDAWYLLGIEHINICITNILTLNIWCELSQVLTKFHGAYSWKSSGHEH